MEQEHSPEQKQTFLAHFLNQARRVQIVLLVVFHVLFAVLLVVQVFSQGLLRVIQRLAGCQVEVLLELPELPLAIEMEVFGPMD